jgi:hypothetical protein
VVFLWAGISVGVAFLATPAKFLVPSLSLPVALEVGRQTFRVYNMAEIGLAFVLLLLTVRSAERRGWALRLSGPVAITIAQTLWLIPQLDHRVLLIQSGAGPVQPSHLHSVYVAAETLKVLWLIGAGLSMDVFAPRPRRSSWMPIPPGQPL